MLCIYKLLLQRYKTMYKYNQKFLILIAIMLDVFRRQITNIEILHSLQTLIIQFYFWIRIITFKCICTDCFIIRIITIRNRYVVFWYHILYKQLQLAITIRNATKPERFGSGRFVLSQNFSDQSGNVQLVT